MEMKIHLDSDIFGIIKTGTKDIEVRLNDEKRKKLKVGDTLIFFKRPLDDESVTKKVKKLEYYNSFEELVKHYEMKRIYLDGCSEQKYLELMERFYSKEEQDKYGVVAIIFE